LLFCEIGLNLNFWLQSACYCRSKQWLCTPKRERN